MFTLLKNKIKRAEHRKVTSPDKCCSPSYLPARFNISSRHYTNNSYYKTLSHSVFHFLPRSRNHQGLSILSRLSLPSPGSQPPTSCPIRFARIQPHESLPVGRLHVWGWDFLPSFSGGDSHRHWGLNDWNQEMMTVLSKHIKVSKDL